ncbi:MAG: RidA family protein [Pseudorhodoplanes sp.]|uniref:RidA family protein n=1 Tax=Pseudorhodoplanes sp. TaxID=1934341 RepID=UPI003D0C0CF6
MPVYTAVKPATWPDRMTFSPAVRAGELLFISGHTATDENRNIVGVGDIAEQTRCIFRKFDAILKMAGGSFDNIVETTEYFLTLDDYKKTADVRREFFKGPLYPAATGVLVASLIRRDALIEIKATAYFGNGR